MRCFRTRRVRELAFLCALLCAGCASKSESDADYEDAVVSGMHASLLTEISALQKAAEDLQAAAPTPEGRGFSTDEDAGGLDAMKAAWIRARTAYEHIEGALAPLFPDIDFAIDARYDDFLTQLGGKGDDDPFDGEGVTGMHAIERILWADGIPQRVVDFEAALPGYKPAAMPASAAEAAEFKTGLCAQFVSDVKTLRAEWQPQKIDLAGAFQGLIALMNEQQEKVNKAASNEEESRYSQRTMVDIRDNLAGTKPIYALFQPWLRSKNGGAPVDAEIGHGFSALNADYARVKGAEIPTPPVTWSAEDPSSADLATDFGRLYRSVKSAVDPTNEGSIVDKMNAAAGLLGFPEFSEAK